MKKTKSKKTWLVSVSPIKAKRNRSEWEGMPEGVQASHHNWPNCQ